MIRWRTGSEARLSFSSQLRDKKPVFEASLRSHSYTKNGKESGHSRISVGANRPKNF